MTDEVLHGQCAVEENAEAFDRVRERDCGIVGREGECGMIIIIKAMTKTIIINEPVWLSGKALGW